MPRFPPTKRLSFRVLKAIQRQAVGMGATWTLVGSGQCGLWGDPEWEGLEFPRPVVGLCSERQSKWRKGCERRLLSWLLS